jgi:uncharacterized integral membrane protein (TIGR00697 family)
MHSNEILFGISTLLDIAFVLWAFNRGRTWLYGTIIVNLILISVLGSKLIVLFGLVTNAGNGFYACVFFATHILVEHYGKEAGYKTLWLGPAFVGFFIVMLQIGHLYTGVLDMVTYGRAITVVFQFLPRVTIASLLAFFVAQYFNVTIYAYLKTITKGRMLFLRKNLTNIPAQFIDSSLFIVTAFWGVFSNDLLIKAVIASWVIKVIVGFIATPALYLTYRLKHD